MIRAGNKTAIRANSGLAGIAVIGPPYFIKTETAVEAMRTFIINPALSIFVSFQASRLIVCAVSSEILASVRQ